MRTWIFKNYLEDEHGEFIPMQTIESEEFGRHFFIDIGFHFISAPSHKEGGYDKSQLDYVTDTVGSYEIFQDFIHERHEDDFLNGED